MRVRPLRLYDHQRQSVDEADNVGAALLDAVRDFGDDARIPEIARRILAEGGSVMSRRLSASNSYWGENHGALSDLAEHRISALDGLSDEQAERCLGKSAVIECGSGDRLLKS